MKERQRSERRIVVITDKPCNRTKECDGNTVYVVFRGVASCHTCGKIIPGDYR